MNLVLARDIFTDKSTSGSLYVDGNTERECYTLELQNVDGKPGSCIPQGLYQVKLTFSPKFSGDRLFDELTARLGVLPNMPEVLGIPGRSQIRIHWGNVPENTEGCILLGETRNTNFVGESRAAFASFYPKLLLGIQQGPVTLQVVGGASRASNHDTVQAAMTGEM